jgi:Tfp pilus assembly protein PilO
MTLRDRLMLMGIVALVVLLGVWFMAVAPEREHAAKVAAEVTSARAQLASAESQAASARGARASYESAYASLVSLGQAVPASEETPTLIYELDHASNSRKVQFSSITTGGPSAPSASSSASTAAQTSTFTQQPFTFVFNGSFEELYKLLYQLEGFTAQTSSGSLHVSGRLLTIDAVNLTPDTGEGQSSGSSKSKTSELTGTITATAYVLPASQTTLGGASVSGPAGAQTAASTTSTSATTPAVIKASP